jgi:signal peptidase II
MSLRVLGPALVAIILILDQLTKWYMTEHLLRAAQGLGDGMGLVDWLVAAPERLGDASIPITSFFSLTMVWNAGISFGLLAGGGALLLTVASLIIAAFFAVWMWRSHERFEIIALAMIIGGALGNVIDRVRFGAVVDFLLFYWGNWQFPAFNVADSAISVGVAALLIHGLLFAKKPG